MRERRKTERKYIIDYIILRMIMSVNITYISIYKEVVSDKQKTLN
jgi:hypothetical protein